jgi:CheY-like chemotaxis protein
MATMAQVLVVDDSSLDRQLTSRLLEEIGVQVRETADGKVALVALAVMAEQLPDVVLTDLQMPNMDGLELVKQIRERFPTVPVILLTAFGSEEIAKR